MANNSLIEEEFNDAGSAHTMPIVPPGTSKKRNQEDEDRELEDVEAEAQLAQ